MHQHHTLFPSAGNLKARTEAAYVAAGGVPLRHDAIMSFVTTAGAVPDADIVTTFIGRVRRAINNAEGAATADEDSFLGASIHRKSFGGSMRRRGSMAAGPGAGAPPQMFEGVTSGAALSASEFATAVTEDSKWNATDARRSFAEVRFRMAPKRESETARAQEPRAPAPSSPGDGPRTPPTDDPPSLFESVRRPPPAKAAFTHDILLTLATRTQLPLRLCAAGVGRCDLAGALEAAHQSESAVVRSIWLMCGGDPDLQGTISADRLATAAQEHLGPELPRLQAEVLFDGASGKRQRARSLAASVSASAVLSAHQGAASVSYVELCGLFAGSSRERPDPEDADEDGGGSGGGGGFPGRSQPQAAAHRPTVQIISDQINAAWSALDVTLGLDISANPKAAMSARIAATTLRSRTKSVIGRGMSLAGPAAAALAAHAMLTHHPQPQPQPQAASLNASGDAAPNLSAQVPAGSGHDAGAARSRKGLPRPLDAGKRFLVSPAIQFTEQAQVEACARKRDFGRSGGHGSGGDQGFGAPPPIRESPVRARRQQPLGSSNGDEDGDDSPLSAMRSSSSPARAPLHLPPVTSPLKTRLDRLRERAAALADGEPHRRDQQARQRDAAGAFDAASIQASASAGTFKGSGGVTMVTVATQTDPVRKPRRKKEAPTEPETI